MESEPDLSALHAYMLTLSERRLAPVSGVAGPQPPGYFYSEKPLTTQAAAALEEHYGLVPSPYRLPNLHWRWKNPLQELDQPQPDWGGSW